MKTTLLTAVMLSAGLSGVWAQSAPPARSLNAHAALGVVSPAVLETYVAGRGPSHRVWHQIAGGTNEAGALVTWTNSFNELASGMHYLRNGDLLEATSDIELTEDGAAATNAAHSVRFAANLNSPVAVELTTPDGLRLRSRINWLTASTAVQVGVPVHVKIVIADEDDHVWDSAIFLKNNRTICEE